MHPVENASPRGDADRDTRRLLTSVGISAMGTWSYNVGIAVYAYQETGSTTWVAIATVGRYIPALLITAAGSRVADRYPRRTVAAAADAFCALVMAVLTVVAAMHGPIVVAILLAALSSGVARIQSAAALGLAADIVPESRLARTATALSTTDAVATAVGPALASLVLAVAAPFVLFALNGVSFAVSAALLTTLVAMPPRITSARTRAERRRGRGADESDVRAATRLVWPLLALRTIAAVIYGSDVVLLAIIATNQLRQGTGGYGWLLAAAGAGGLLGASWLRRQADDSRTAWRAMVGLVAYSLPLIFFVASPLLPGSLAVQVVRGMGCVLLTATVVAGLQRAVPSAVAGRVFGLSNVLVLVGTSAGALVAPGLVNLLGLDTTLLVVGVGACVAGLLVLPAVRRFDRDGSDAMAALDPRVDTLRRLSIFEDASRSTLYSVADRIVDLDLPAGLELIVEGDPSDCLYVLVRGRVEVYVNTTAGRVQVREMKAPAYVGEIGILHGVSRTATVVTSSECHAWRIPAEAFLDAAGRAGLSGALTEGVVVRLNASAGVS